ncbi:Lar family restriction alleviation protein [Hydrogenophaga sp.]|uniref:Lar family restriction alleviation protein n=1 Tax=Hydrogenophaga sp. TaxID=1904254 RepID=UPI003F723120
MNTIEKLAPCPFCGSTGAQFERIGTPRQSCIVACNNCGARHESSDEGLACGSSWNDRAQQAGGVPAGSEAMRDALESIREHCMVQSSALAKAIVATCDSALAAPSPSAVQPLSEAQLEEAARQDYNPSIDWSMPENLGISAVPRAYFRRGVRFAERAHGIVTPQEPTP